MKTLIYFLVLVLSSLYGFGKQDFGITVSKGFCLGDQDIFFESIASVCEDNDGNFYVLDRKAAKVLKFSGEGKLLLSFGNRGQGPGDFVDPHHISISKDGQLIVHETKNHVSFFDLSGEYKERKSVKSGLGIYYIGSDLYSGWRWTPDGKRQFVSTLDGKQVENYHSIPSHSFSVNVPDETGRMVMFSFFANEYTPAFLFGQNDRYYIIGITNNYNFKIIDKITQQVSTISRDIRADKISQAERKYFAGLIHAKARFPDIVKQKLVQKIPKYKNFFEGIYVTGTHIWALRIKDSANNDQPSTLIDIFSLTGKFKGTVFINGNPLYVSGKNLYFEKTNSQEDLLLCKYKYNLESASHR